MAGGCLELLLWEPIYGQREMRHIRRWSGLVSMAPTIVEILEKKRLSVERFSISAISAPWQPRFFAGRERSRAKGARPKELWGFPKPPGPHLGDHLERFYS